MKNLVCFFIVFLILAPFSGNFLFGQEYVVVKVNLADELKAQAGEDKSIDKGSSVMLGDSQSAKGGTGDYYYIWSPSELLDNPLIANPIASPEITTTFTLLVLDENGCNALDEITIYVGSTNNGQFPIQSNCKVYPNPSGGKFYLQFNGNIQSKKVDVRIYDLLGKVIYMQNIELNSSYISREINISNSPNGIYIMTISSPSTLLKFKLFKE